MATRDRNPRGRLQAGDLLSVRAGSATARLLLGERRLILRVVARPAMGSVPDTAEWVPSLCVVAGPLRLCDVDLQTAATGAGTLTTVTCRVQAATGWLTPAARKPVLAAAQTLLGIATLIAREPMVVVAAAIVRDGRVLAARRRGDGAVWELPGGKAEPGETDEVALRREIAEELSIPVLVRSRIGSEVDLGDHRILRCYRADAGGTPQAQEHEELRWLAAEELRSVTWLPADLALLPAVESCLRRS